jgi:DHA1 family inner membrane transport protein
MSTSRSSMPGSPAFARLRSRHLAALSVGTFTLGIDGFVLSGLLPQVASTLHVSVAAAGQLTSVFAIVYAIGSPVIATATGNWDRKRLLLAGMGVFVIGVALQAAGATFVVVVVGRVLAALGAAAFQATAYGVAGLLSDDAGRPRALAIVAGGSSVAAVAGLPFGILIGQAFGWRSAMGVLLALALISGAMTFLLPTARAPQLPLRRRIAVLRNGQVLAVLTGTILVMTPGFLVLAFVAKLLDAAGSWTVALVVAEGAGQVVGTFLAPRSIRRRSARFTVVLAGTVLFIASVGLALFRFSPVGATLAMALLGIGLGFAVVPQQARLFRSVPEIASVAVGLNGSAIYCGSALGAAFGGLALVLGGSEAIAPTAAALALIATAALIALKVERPSNAG